jgi:hypothetical protein
MIHVLVTSVGGGVGQSVLDSISHLNDEYRITGLDLSDKVLARNQCDKFLISPRINDSSYVDFLIDVCKKSQIDVLVPGHDGELELLSHNIERFQAENVNVIVSPTKIVTSSRNKFNWYSDYSDKIKIVPTVLYDDYVVSQDSYSDIVFPVIVKPAAGSASSGIKIFLSLEELLRNRIPADESINYVVQPYLMPQKDDPDYLPLKRAVNKRTLLQKSEISCQIIYNKNSEVIGIFVSKNSLKNGVPVTIEPIIDRAILSVVEDISEKLKDDKVVGPVNIQGRLTEHGLVFFEMNLRFTGITGNRSQFGFNEVSSVINAFHGQPPYELLSGNTSRIGARQVGCTTSYALGKRAVNTILMTGASSWAAKNLLIYMLKTGFLDSKKIILSCRKPLVLQDELAILLASMNVVKKLIFVGGTNLELSKSIGLSDVVLNFASARPPHGAQKIHQATLFNLSLVDMLKHGNTGLIINMSSQSVYDSSQNSVHTEKSKVSACSPYAISKLIVEEAFLSINKFSKGTSVINLRLGRLWGGKVEIEKSQFPYRLIDSLIGVGSFEFSNLDNELSMLDVDDLSSAVFNLMEK